ncbi:MAG: UbiA family prenyltransferase [Bacteroidota bacterium]
MYKYLNLLNLDVVLGAVICSMAFAEILKVEVEWSSYLLLSLTVWSIYTFDRLLDSLRSDGGNRSERHYFHHKNRIPLTSLIIVSIIVSVALVPLLPYKTLVWGVVLMGVVLAYLITIHSLKIKWLVHKELVIGIVYTCGVLLGPVSIFSGEFDGSFYLLCTIFFLTVLNNLFIFSLYDEHFDILAKFPSLVTVCGARMVKGLIIALFSIAAMLNALVFLHLNLLVSTVFLSMLFMLFLVFWFSQNPFFKSHYRLLGDAIFLFPIVIL